MRRSLFERTLKSGIELEFLNWWGFKNPNSSILILDQWRKKPAWGITILPFRFWEKFYITKSVFKENPAYKPLRKKLTKYRRFAMGLGLFTFYLDYIPKDNE